MSYKHTNKIAGCLVPHTGVSGNLRKQLLLPALLNSQCSVQSSNHNTILFLWASQPDNWPWLLGSVPCFWLGMQDTRCSQLFCGIACSSAGFCPNQFLISINMMRVRYLEIWWGNRPMYLILKHSWLTLGSQETIWELSFRYSTHQPHTLFYLRALLP